MRVCVYAAAQDNIGIAYKEAARALGLALADKGHSLVYGGGCTGLMGAFSDGMLDRGAEVIGIIPEFMTDYPSVSHQCTELRIVESMSARKEAMEALAEAFIILPGGVGTYDEFFQILALKSLGQRNEPVILYNTLGYFDPLLALIEDGIEKGFIPERVRGLLKVTDRPEDVL